MIWIIIPLPQAFDFGFTIPYRRELLSRLSIPFECQSPDLDEEQIKRQLEQQKCSLFMIAQGSLQSAKQWPNGC